MKLSMRLSLVWIAGLSFFALLAPFLGLQDPAHFHPDSALLPPSWTEAPFLGTDPQGRDLLARLLYGARISLLIGVLGTAVALAFGAPYGAFAALKGGRPERSMMRLADGLESVPMVAFILFLLSILQEYRFELSGLGIGRLHLLFLAIGLLFWVPTARIARAEALRINRSPYVDAARSAGASSLRLLRSHFLPNLAPATLVMVGLTLPRVILMEAFLSFLGLGVEAPQVSWGILASEGLAAMNPLVECSWLLWVPAIALGLTLLSLQTLSDGLRDHWEAKGRL